MIRILRFLLGLVFATIAAVTVSLWFSSPPYVVLLTILFAVLAAWTMRYDTGLSHRTANEIPPSIQAQLLDLRKEPEMSSKVLKECQRIEREVRQEAERMEREFDAELTANPPAKLPLQGTPAGKPAAPLSKHGGPN